MLLTVLLLLPLPDARGIEALHFYAVFFRSNISMES
jgi:hypothetical protein